MTKLGYAEPEKFEIFSIDDLTDTNWRKPIVEYLENTMGSIDRKFKYMSLSNFIIGN